MDQSHSHTTEWHHIVYNVNLGRLHLQNMIWISRVVVETKNMASTRFTFTQTFNWITSCHFFHVEHPCHTDHSDDQSHIQANHTISGLVLLCLAWFRWMYSGLPHREHFVMPRPNPKGYKWVNSICLHLLNYKDKNNKYKWKNTWFSVVIFIFDTNMRWYDEAHSTRRTFNEVCSSIVA